MIHHNIDIVIAWVDNSDPEWLHQKQKYNKNVKYHNDMWNDSDARYRDWDLLRYWFRGIEKFAPWARKIHFVTWGHIPNWLNVDNERLSIVKHEDFIPNKYLPTFSSHCIELNLHRIPDLSEQFIYFNDDMFLLNNTVESDFFKNGLPCDAAIISPIYLKQNGIRAEINNMYLINDAFDKNKVIRNHISKWFNYKYGKYLIRTCLMMPFNLFSGFYIHHLPTSLLKSTYIDVWNQYTDILDETCSHKFRENTDVNQWLMEFWQYCTGQFAPRSPNMGCIYEGNNLFNSMLDTIKHQKFKIICCNDSIDIDDFEVKKELLIKEFNKLLPDKSVFEL